MKPIRTVLVPIDFSPNSEEALDYAVHLAKMLGADIHLLHSYLATLGSVMPYGEVLPVDFETQVRTAAGEKLDEIRRRVEARGVKVSMHLRESPASVAICDAAADLGADMIVMGTRGLSGLKHVLLGSVAERTVRNATCPVLTVKGTHG
jgi:nucleotide-binding universal stress UspA family protein